MYAYKKSKTLMFIMTTFWIIAGKNFQILDQILCPKTLELDMFEIKKCNKSFVCCKYILEASEIVYKKKQKLFILKFIFYCGRSSLLGRIHRPYWNTTKTQDFWLHIALTHSQYQMIQVEGHVRSCRERNFKIFLFFKLFKKTLRYILHHYLGSIK